MAALFRCHDQRRRLWLSPWVLCLMAATWSMQQRALATITAVGGLTTAVQRSPVNWLESIVASILRSLLSRIDGDVIEAYGVKSRGSTSMVLFVIYGCVANHIHSMTIPVFEARSLNLPAIYYLLCQRKGTMLSSKTAPTRSSTLDRFTLTRRRHWVYVNPDINELTKWSVVKNM